MSEEDSVKGGEPSKTATDHAMVRYRFSSPTLSSQRTLGEGRAPGEKWGTAFFFSLPSSRSRQAKHDGEPGGKCLRLIVEQERLKLPGLHGTSRGIR